MDLFVHLSVHSSGPFGGPYFVLGVLQNPENSPWLRPCTRSATSLKSQWLGGEGSGLQCIRPRFEPTPEQEVYFSRVSFPGKNKLQKMLTQHHNLRMHVEELAQGLNTLIRTNIYRELPSTSPVSVARSTRFACSATISGVNSHSFRSR